MMPAIIANNVETGNERWKPTTTVGEDNVKNMPAGELPQSFITIDGNIYYLSSVNNYPQSGIVETAQNINGNGQESQLFTQQLNGPEIVNHTNQNDNVPNDIPRDELKRLIQLQFEYYFSRENLANDSYLVSQMDSDQYVYVSTVAKFNQIRKLTSDMNLIVEALKESPYVQLDESAQKVRANAKRCIVILREIPESTPIDEVKALLSHPNCPKWVSFEFAHNDSWYVTFDCEEDAKKAYHYLHEEVQHFQGRPLMARIKAQTLLSRTVYLPKGASTPSSATVTSTSPSVSTTQYTTAQQPLNTFAVPPNAIFHQPQSFPFYAGTPVNSNPIMPGTWIGPRHTTFFIQQDIHPKNNFNKHKSTNIQFVSNKGRGWNNRNNFNNKTPKLPLQQCNGILDNDEQQMLSSARRNQNPNMGNTNTFTAFKKEAGGRFTRTGGNARKELRTNVEGSRYQRLRERQQKENIVKSPEIEYQQMLSNNDLTLDLAIENFPALPSPNSPNENETASSLKELASSALQNVQEQSTSSEGNDVCRYSREKQSIEASLSEALTNTCIGGTCSNNILSQNPKISYAQMAQKPNKPSLCKETFENDDKGFIELPNTDITKSIDNTNKCQNDSDNKNNTCTAKTQRKTSKGSSEGFQDDLNNLSETSTDNIVVDYPFDNDTSTAPKETYASKFGTVSSSTKSQDSLQLPVSKGNSTCSSNTGNVSWVNSQSKGPSKNLPSPKPLMSQVIKTPDNEKGPQLVQDTSENVSVGNGTAHETLGEDLERKVEDSLPIEEESVKDED